MLANALFSNEVSNTLQLLAIRHPLFSSFPTVILIEQLYTLTAAATRHSLLLHPLPWLHDQ
jgi:hypothetical protein